MPLFRKSVPAKPLPAPSALRMLLLTTAQHITKELPPSAALLTPLLVGYLRHAEEADLNKMADLIRDFSNAIERTREPLTLTATVLDP